MEVLGASTLEIPGTGAYGHTQTISVHQSVSVCPHMEQRAVRRLEGEHAIAAVVEQLAASAILHEVADDGRLVHRPQLRVRHRCAEPGLHHARRGGLCPRAPSWDKVRPIRRPGGRRRGGAPRSDPPTARCGACWRRDQLASPGRMELDGKEQNLRVM